MASDADERTDGLTKNCFLDDLDEVLQRQEQDQGDPKGEKVLVAASVSSTERKVLGLVSQTSELLVAVRSPALTVCTTEMEETTCAPRNPSASILVQPQPRSLRFRYKCEGRYPGALTGVGTTNEVKVFPKIGVNNYRGKFVVVISCVTKDSPYFPHPHNLVAKDGCKQGVYRNVFGPDDMTATFTCLGIQCVKKSEVKASLEERKKLKIDPFHTGFSHADRIGDIDLNAVRLCFQVFVESYPGCEKFSRPLQPVVSDIIYDRKAMSDLLITKLSHTVAPLQGGLEMILLCDKVSKDDIEVCFYKEDSVGTHMWEEKADIVSVHKQVAVCFRSPNCVRHVLRGAELYSAKVQLRRKSQVNEVGEGREIFLCDVGVGGAAVASSAGEDYAGLGLAGVTADQAGVKRRRSGADHCIQMQMALVAQAAFSKAATSDQVTVTVPRLMGVMPVQSPFAPSEAPRQSGRGVSSPHSESNSPAPSAQQQQQYYRQVQPIAMMESALAAVHINQQHPQATAAGQLSQCDPHPIGVATLGAVTDSVNEATDKLFSSDIEIPSGMSFGSDINLNIGELQQMSGPTATRVLSSVTDLGGDLTQPAEHHHQQQQQQQSSPHVLQEVSTQCGVACETGLNGIVTNGVGPCNGSVCELSTAPVTDSVTMPGNFSESMFESGTSLNQLDLLNSGHLRQFKQEGTES